jgi:membrane-bound lytic murein transglycosylase B
LPIAIQGDVDNNGGVARSLALKTFVLLIICGCMTAGAMCASADDTLQIPTLTASLTAKLRQNFSDEAIGQIFSDPRIELYPQILERRGKGIDYLYKKFGLLAKESIARGRRVLTENRGFFENVEGLYGVEKEAIVAVFRVETNLGRYVGAYPVFNSLLTMATLPNRRSEWAEEELVYLLVLCRDLGKEPLSVKGSWAGAFGLCQFIPSSFLAYAVDGNDDGVVDLFNFSDAMASIVNYLRVSGWHNNNTAGKEKAVYTYNNDESYVKAGRK